MHHVHINNLLNHNQFEFTPKKCTTDAAITVKEFLEEGLRKWLITILVSLDFKGAFDAAWWPSILMALKDFNCPRNVYYLTKSYFSHRTAVMSISTVQVEEEVNEVAPRILLRTRILEYPIQLTS